MRLVPEFLSVICHVRTMSKALIYMDRVLNILDEFKNYWFWPGRFFRRFLCRQYQCIGKKARCLVILAGFWFQY